MDIENIDEAVFYQNQIKTLRKAQVELTEKLEVVTSLEEHGWKNQHNSGMYGLYIGEHRDGSGFQLNLTGCGISICILRDVLNTIEDRIIDLEKNIKNL